VGVGGVDPRAGEKEPRAAGDDWKKQEEGGVDELDAVEAEVEANGGEMVASGEEEEEAEEEDDRTLGPAW
jgi:hypothetical protein